MARTRIHGTRPRGWSGKKGWARTRPARFVRGSGVVPHLHSRSEDYLIRLLAGATGVYVYSAWAPVRKRRGPVLCSAPDRPDHPEDAGLP